MIDQLFVASGNQGKLAEFVKLAASLDTRGRPAALPMDLSLLPNFAQFPEFDESAPTFAENAVGKALHYSQLAGVCVLADDSGLVVPALNGAPGVLSARYAGPGATSAQRNAKLLEAMRNLQGADRHAYFVCVLAVAGKGRALAVVSARSDGEILDSPRGSEGFGYDPVFYIKDLNKTFAELTPEEKNQRSHRGQAFRRLAHVLPTLSWPGASGISQ
jgi:XTP/dITP diphosphohydrolase